MWFKIFLVYITLNMLILATLHTIVNSKFLQKRFSDAEINEVRQSLKTREVNVIIVLMGAFIFLRSLFRK